MPADLRSDGRSRDLGEVSPPTIAADPLGFLASTAGHDLVRYTTGPWNVVLANRASLARHVLATGWPTYTKFGTPDLFMLAPMLGRGLMTSDGDAWQRQRKMCQPSFRPEELRRFVAPIDGVARAVVDRIASSAGGDRAVDISVEMTRATVRVVALCLFGVDIDSRIDEFAGAVDEMNEGISSFDPSNAAGAAAFRRARAVVFRLAEEILDDAPGGPGSLVGELRALGERAAAVEQVVTLLMAGHETTAKCLTWTLFLLDRHADVLARARAEARAVLGPGTATREDVASLNYLWQVLQESMRLYPPVWSLTRMCSIADDVEGHRIDPGTLVIVSPYAMHRDPRFWPAPERFDPARFDGPASSHPPDRGFMPFGGGPRSCIGRGLAEIELRLFLARMIDRLRLRLADGHEVLPEALVTLRPRGGMPMHVECVS